MPTDSLSDETEPHIRLAWIHALQALVEVQRGLDEIERERSEIALDDEALDDESYLARWESELKNYEGLLRQIVPAEYLWRVERASSAGPRPMKFWK